MRRGSLVLLVATFWAFMAAAVPAQTTEVEAQDNKFDPPSITVAVGATVTFKNTGKLPHNATAEDESFETGNLNAGQSSKPITLTKAGTFKYVCTYHESLGMTGTIVVEDSSTAASPASEAAAATGGDSESDNTDDAEAAEAPRAVPPSEKYFPMLALAMLVGGLGLVGLGYLKTVLKTAERGK